MDKNTLLGLLLMGAVIFGFMALNDTPQTPQPEKKQQTVQQPPVQQLIADSITDAERAVLAPTIRQYGVASTEGEKTVYTVNTPKATLSLADNTVSGTITVGDTAINVQDILNDNLSNLAPAVAVEAVNNFKSTVFDIQRYQGFSRNLTGKDSTVTLSNELINVELSSLGGAISRVELQKYDTYVNKDTAKVVLLDKANDAYSFTITTSNQRFETNEFYFTPIQENDSTVLMRLDLGNGAYWGIRYSLAPDSYIVHMDIVQNKMEQVTNANIATIDFHWWQKMARQELGRTFEERNSAIYYKYVGDDVDNLSEMGDDAETISEKLRWIGFKNQFFSCVLIPETYFLSAQLKSSDLKELEVNYLKNMRADATLEYSATDSNPASFDFFFGPNSYPLLSSYDDAIAKDQDLELTELVPLGWSLFRWINTLIVIPVFTFLSSFISNYGIIILILTLFIKLILFPFTYKSYKSQAKMRVLAPEIKEINDKYPGQENAMARQQHTMALYSKVGASPFSGCLPMLLQMPILIALFSFFPSCIELRGQSFLWAHDLSAPDAIFSWDVHIPFISSTFGNHISLFCLLMTATNIIYSHINMQNQPGGNSMPGMKWMMYLMPIMFLFFFNDYASGLSYYYFLSLLITIIQTYAFRRFIDEKKVRQQLLENAKKPRKKSGFMARLEEAQRKQQAMLREQEKQRGKRR